MGKTRAQACHWMNYWQERWETHPTTWGYKSKTGSGMPWYSAEEKHRRDELFAETRRGRWALHARTHRGEWWKRRRWSRQAKQRELRRWSEWSHNVLDSLALIFFCHRVPAPTNIFLLFLVSSSILSVPGAHRWRPVCSVSRVRGWVTQMFCSVQIHFAIQRVCIPSWKTLLISGRLSESFCNVAEGIEELS